MADNPINLGTKDWQTAKYKQILPKEVIDQLNYCVDKLATALGALTRIMNLLRFFISAFSSYSAILKTFIDFAQKQLSQFLGDLLNAGVYYNVLVPPALLKSLYDAKASSGGYQGFLTRLKVSLNNPADKNAPNFSSDASVGGFIIMVDTESVIEIYQGLQFLADMFDFFKLFPINIQPLPPRNVRSIAGHFPQFDGSTKLGVKLTWDAPRVAGFSHYRISRSQVPFPYNHIITNPVPSGLLNILKAAEGMLATRKTKWPEVETYDYSDKTFNKEKPGKPVVVLANPITGGGSYIDYDGIVESDVGGVKKYYYVIESGFAIPPIWGPRTPEIPIAVNLRGCIKSNQQGVIQHKKTLEFVSSGATSLGMWSTIQMKAVLPFMDTVVNMLNKFLAGLAGALKTNTKSFLDFIKGIQEKLQTYADILGTLIEVILAIEAFFAGMPRVAFLNVPPESGGVDGFMNRVTNAKPPPDRPGFSGPNGFTVGIVFIYGFAAMVLESGSISEAEAKVLEKALALKTEALGKAFDLLMKSLS